MKLYNTLNHKIQVFNPLDPDNVKIYTCGPTVYNYAHIGNLTSYIYWDFLIRTLKIKGYKINRVLNLTDVGHLSSDADEGEDKLEKGAKKEGKTVWEIADFYANYFLEKYHDLNLIEPKKIARATDFIKEATKLVDRLVESGYTYEITDGIYFDTTKFEKYSDFAKLDLKNLKSGARIAKNPEKKHHTDFAVWKFIQPDEDHAMRWKYRGKWGYPGWHLECSAIIHKMLGEPIDIHTGGIDHIPVHHTNEIAQSEAAYHKPLARFWLHCNFITIEEEKISKSLGNTYTMEDLVEKGFSPLDFKLWVLQGHYQSERNFSFTDLAAAKKRRLNWRNKIALLYQNPTTSTSDNQFLKSVLTAAYDNLNSATICSKIDTSNLSLSDWQFIDKLFGLDLIASTPDITTDIKELIEKREEARTRKDFSVADKIRDELSALNITVNDSDSGPIWQYLN